MSVVSDLAALKAKLAGDPQAIRDLAGSLRTAGGHVATATNRLVTNVNEVGKAWAGGSATAFTGYMAAYPKAGGDLQGALTSCATALDTAANALETAHGTVKGLHASAGTAESTYRGDHADAAQSDVDAYVKAQLGGDPVGQARKAVSDAEEALTTAKGDLEKQLGEDGFGFFKGIRQPGGTDFLPGDNEADWRKVTGYSPTGYRDDRTTLASTDGGPGAVNVSGGGAGAPSSYGNTPAPRAQVVEWIKQALTVIKSPEMAAILRRRGLDVSDLDPNDPQDIQRIWTIIHHESGGNPNAINNWDINARNGVPSQGLMQTIPPTFNAHHLPGYDKIREPVDNIIAGVLYTYSRYGDLSGHPGIASLSRGGGYKPY
ncbi:WXG100 family type VII secretion target [Nonomuraea sp. NPDC048826]|uniref:transglycosylase SLT domain-containing protein n=1 Tax=Nonomuraea sp. NPDC048826 TaxID=3364347 RepID=UPI00372317B8